MGNGTTPNTTFKGAWEAFLDKWSCLERCTEGLGRLWGGESPEAVLEALEAAEKRFLALSDCGVGNGTEAASLRTCRAWLEEIMEAFESAEDLAEEAEEVQYIREYGGKLNAVGEYLDALEGIWPEGRAMLQMLAEARPVLERLKREQKEKEQKGAKEVREEKESLVEAADRLAVDARDNQAGAKGGEAPPPEEGVEDSVARVFANLMKQAAAVWQQLEGKGAEKREAKLRGWGWRAEAVRHIAAWRRQAWQDAKEGLGEASTRAAGLAWRKALPELVLIQATLRQFDEAKEATGETRGDIYRILAAAIFELSNSFEGWAVREIAHVAELLAPAPAAALRRLREVLGKAEGACREVTLPGEDEGSEETCAQVAQAWKFLQETAVKEEKISFDPETWKRRYVQWAEAERQLAVLVEQWEKAAEALVQVEERIKGRKRLADYLTALDMLQGARAAWPGHSRYEAVVEHWLAGARRWARRQAQGKSAEVKAVQRALGGWDIAGAEEALERLKERWDDWQGAVKRVEEELFPVALSGEVQARLADVAALLDHLFEEPPAPQHWQGALAATWEAFQKAEDRWKTLQRQVAETKKRRQEALEKIGAWKAALEKTEKKRAQVSEELERWLRDERRWPKVQDLPEVQAFVRWLDEQKTPLELWDTAWTAYNRGRYAEAWERLKELEKKDTRGEIRRQYKDSYDERYGLIRWVAQWEKARPRYEEQDYAAAYRLMQDAWGEINVKVREAFQKRCGAEGGSQKEGWKAACEIYGEWQKLQKDYREGQEKEKALRAVWSARGWRVPVDFPLNEENTAALTQWLETLEVEEKARFLEVTAQYAGDTTTPVYWRAWYREMRKGWGEKLLQYYREEARAAVMREGWKEALALWERAEAALPDVTAVTVEKDYAGWYAAMEACVERWKEKAPWAWKETAAEAAKWCGECEQELNTKQGDFLYVPQEEKMSDLGVLGQWRSLFRQEGREGALEVWEAWEAHMPAERWLSWKEKKAPFYRLWQVWWKQWIEHLLEGGEREEQQEEVFYETLGAYLAAQSLQEEAHLVERAKSRLARLFAPPGVKEEWNQRVAACAAKVERYQDGTFGKEEIPALGKVYCQWQQCLEEINRLQRYRERIVRAGAAIRDTHVALELPKLLNQQHREYLALAVRMLREYRLGEKLRAGEKIESKGGGGGNGMSSMEARGIAGVAVEIVERWRARRRLWADVLAEGLKNLSAVYLYSDGMTEENPYLQGLRVLWKEVLPKDGRKPEDRKVARRLGLARWVKTILEALKQELREEQEACKEVMSAEAPVSPGQSDGREAVTPERLGAFHVFTYLGVTSHFPINGKGAAEWEDILEDVKAQAENVAYYIAVKKCVEERKEDLEQWRKRLYKQPENISFSTQMAWIQEQIRRLTWWYAVDWASLEGMVRWRKSPVQDEVGQGECLTEEIAVGEVRDWQDEARESSPGAPANETSEALAQRAKKVLEEIRDIVERRGEERMLMRRCQQAWEAWVEKLERHLRVQDLSRVQWKRRADENAESHWKRIMEEAEETVRTIANLALQRKELAILRPVASLLLQYDPEEPSFQWMCEATGCEHLKQKTSGGRNAALEEGADDFYGPNVDSDLHV